MCQVLLCFNILVATGSDTEMLLFAKKNHYIKYLTKQPHTIIKTHITTVGQRRKQNGLEYDGIAL